MAAPLKVMPMALAGPKSFLKQPSVRLLVVGGLSAMALLGLALAGQAPLVPALVLAGLVGGLAVSFARRSVREAKQLALEAKTAAGRNATAFAPPFEAILRTLPEPVMVIAALEMDDLAGQRIQFANTAARDFFRIQEDGALLITAIRNPDVLELLDEALFGGLAGEVAYELGGAQDRYLRATVRPLGEAADGRRLALLFMRDETNARRNERMRADFLANASHELRTPLASLSGFIETLRGHARDDPDARERFLQIMATQAERMSRLIDDLLSLSRIELNEHIAPEGCVDLSLVVTDVADALGPLLAESGVELILDLPPMGQAMAVGDRDQMVQVVQNLIDNGVKYSRGRGPVRVECKVGVTGEAAVAMREPQAARLALLTPDDVDDGHYICLRVTDSGPGIARQYLPRLAERFYRVEGQKSGERSGTGLGLAIVKHIINRHRGGFAVESLAGSGAAFIAYFPIHSAHVKAVAGPESLPQGSL
jgi:two-component system phosphate regulon sensor histidine kinase PhoR